MDRIGLFLARILRRPITLPDFNGGKITYYPDGGYSHKL